VKNPRAWTVARYLDSDHLAPTPLNPGGRGVIDEYLALQGQERRIAVRSPHFSLTPQMVAGTRLVLTTGRQFCERYLGQLPVAILPCPVEFPRMMYYQLWHERTHASNASRWLREQVKAVATKLQKRQ